MANYTHIVNPVNVSEKSDLHFAQPITFASLHQAITYSKTRLDIDLCTTQFAEDHSVIPSYCRVLPDLERSVLDFGSFNPERKLPLIGDILQKAYDHSDSPYLIYTNMDIGVLPHFYDLVDHHMKQGADALVINRRRLQRIYFRTDQLPDIYSDYGKMHPGYDCFVFKRELFPQFVLGSICIGIPFIEIGLFHNLLALSNSVKLMEREHVTFHIGMEVLPPVNKGYYWHNRNEFESKVFPALKEKLSRSKYPYAALPFWSRLIKYGLNPNFRFHVALELEGKDWKRKWNYAINELRFSIMDKLR